jgi:type IV secretory pathway VirB2 component (pilin)
VISSPHLHHGSGPSSKLGVKVGIKGTVALYVVLMVAIVVGVDLLFFRNRFWERLIVNIGIVLVFAAFYLRFLKRP